MKKITLSHENVENYFYFKLLSQNNSLYDFNCKINEYNDYLVNDALRSMKDHIALTWLLIDIADDKIVSYMSLIMDSIKLTFTEKELHNLNYPFRTIPAMKIAKLAVDNKYIKRFKGIGTFMIESAERFALACNNEYCAARFLTVDADIEHDEGVLAFYQKKRFYPKRRVI